FTVNKTVDQSTVNANTVTVFRAGPDGVLNTGDDVAIPLTNVAFTFTPLKTGRLGPEQVSFTLPGGLTNDIYEVLIHGAASPAVTDIGGNPLNGSGAAGTDASVTIVVNNPAAAHIVFAGPASTVTDPTAAQGTRANPFPTINQAIATAGVGD